MGRLGNLSSVDPLIDALDDDDLRVRISAIRGLGNIRSDEVHELLFWHFGSDFDPQTFPTLADVLSEREDRRIVRPTINHLTHFRSSAVRLQLLNSVCRALGAGDQFYRLLSQEDTRRIDSIGRLFRDLRADLSTAAGLEPAQRPILVNLCDALLSAYEEDRMSDMRETALAIVRTVRDSLSGRAEQAFEVLSVFIVIVALNGFIRQNRESSASSVAEEIFLAVCLSHMGKGISSIST